MDWYPPPLDFFKFNVDGVVVKSSSLGSYGGVLGDRNRSLLGNFVLNISRCFNLEVEVLAIFHALEVVWGSGIHKLLMM